MSPGRTDKHVLISGDSARDYPEDGYAGQETFIAVGCQTGKILVYNVLGLWVYELSMDGPVVSLEWVGDMAGSSTLPNRQNSISTIVEKAEDHPIGERVPSQDQLSSSDKSDTEYGTVKKNALPDPFVVRSPLRFDGSRDLFSVNPPATYLGRRKSIIPHPSPSKHDSVHTPPRKKSFLRPRIATETFKDPSITRAPHRSLPLSPIVSTTASVQEVLKKTDSRQVFDVFFSDALRAPRSRSSSESSRYSLSSDSSKIWSRPLAANKRSGRSNPVGYRYACGAGIPIDLQGEIRKGQTSPPSPNFPRPMRQVKEEDMEERPTSQTSCFGDHFRSEGEDRGINASTSTMALGSQMKRVFSFDSGIHPLERRCEEGFFARVKSNSERVMDNNGDKKDNQPEGVGLLGRNVSGEECELLKEHRKLRREMAMLREEFKAFRESFQKEVKR